MQGQGLSHRDASSDVVDATSRRYTRALPTDPDLAVVNAAWSELSGEVKATIVALVKGSRGC